MNVLEMMKEDVNSIVGKVVEYDYGGDKTFKIKVSKTHKTPWVWRDEEGQVHESYCYAISENGTSFYTVSYNNAKIVE